MTNRRGTQNVYPEEIHDELKRFLGEFEIEGLALFLARNMDGDILSFEAFSAAFTPQENASQMLVQAKWQE